MGTMGQAYRRADSMMFSATERAAIEDSDGNSHEICALHGTKFAGVEMLRNR